MGFPLIAYSIVASTLCKDINRTIVSTDAEDIAEIAGHYGAEVPFLRPKKFASDTATDIDVINHALDWLQDHESTVPDFIVYLRPTTPLRDAVLISNAIHQVVIKPHATSLRSAHPLAEPPQKMFQINKAGYFEGFFPNEKRPEYYNLPRQLFPEAFHPNGYVDVIKVAQFKRTGALFGKRILSFVTPIVTEIDRIEDFEQLEYQMSKKGHSLHVYLSKKFPKR